MADPAVTQHRLSFKALALALALSACSPPSQNRYGWQDVGHASTLEFGTIVSAREVQITGRNTGMGAAAGAGTGVLAGSYVGRGGGSIAGMIAGALVGGLAGAVAEQAIQDRKGVEYTITESNGKTVSITQNIAADDRPLKPGDRVVVQTSGTYQRVLPADSLPDRVKRAKKIKVTD